MQPNIHPFEKYPFDVKKLPADIRREVDEFDFYTTSRAIAKSIAEHDITDANTLLCWAYFEWLDAMALGTGAEILGSGETALKIINGILEKEPGHKPSLKLEKYINGEIKKVHRANKWYDKYHAVPPESLSLKEAEDFAYFLSDCTNDGKFKELELQLWQRIHREKPDTRISERDGKEYYGFNFYYLCRIANVLWRDLGRREEARPLLWQIINWPNAKDAELYCYNTSNAIEHLLLEAAEKGDGEEFVKLTGLMVSKMEEMNVYRAGIGKTPLKLIIREQPAGKILQFALASGNIGNLRTIMQHFFAGEVVFIRDQRIKENMQKARALTA